MLGGVHTWQLQLTSCGGTSTQIGICTASAPLDIRSYDRLWGATAEAIVWDHERGVITSGHTLSGTLNTGDVVTITLDFPGRKVTFTKSGTTLEVPLTETQAAQAWYPCACSTLSTGAVKLIGRSGSGALPVPVTAAPAVAAASTSVAVRVLQLRARVAARFFPGVARLYELL
jgi:hypothetical protein